MNAKTGILASDVANNAAVNYAEAVERGEVLKLWQRWYKEKSEEWKKFKDSLPTNPNLPK